MSTHQHGVGSPRSGPAVFREQRDRKGLLQHQDVTNTRVIDPSFYLVPWENHRWDERLWKEVVGVSGGCRGCSFWSCCWSFAWVNLAGLRFALKQGSDLVLNDRSK